jgi:hypothetical protein
MLSRIRTHFKGSRLARMSNGTYCVIRDLGLVKGGKGMRHHEVLLTISFAAFRKSVVPKPARSVAAGTPPGRTAWLGRLLGFRANLGISK